MNALGFYPNNSSERNLFNVGLHVHVRFSHHRAINTSLWARHQLGSGHNIPSQPTRRELLLPTANVGNAPLVVLLELSMCDGMGLVSTFWLRNQSQSRALSLQKETISTEMRSARLLSYDARSAFE